MSDFIALLFHNKLKSNRFLTQEGGQEDSFACLLRIKNNHAIKRLAGK